MSIDEARSQVEEALDQVPLAQLPTTQEPSKFVESVPPLAVVDPKGKAIATRS